MPKKLGPQSLNCVCVCVCVARGWDRERRRNILRNCRTADARTLFIWGLEEGQPRTELPWLSLLSWKSPSKGLGRRPVPSGSGPRPHGSGCRKKPFDLAGHTAAAGPRLCPGADGMGGPRRGRTTPLATFRPLPRSHGRAFRSRECGKERTTRRRRGRRRGQWVSAPRGRWAGPTAPRAGTPASQRARGAGQWARAPRPAAPPEGRRRELVPAARAAVVAAARSAGL